MTTIQEKLMELIREIDTICKRHDIPYYLSGGSVIGAIRHKGFIPWDDDIDILLDSKYWDKFYEVFQKEMPENRTLGCLENNIDFPNMVYRYCDVSTTQFHKNELLGDSTAGVVIDVILLDSFPGGEEAWRDHMKNLLLFSDLTNVFYGYSTRFDIDVPYRRYFYLTKIFGKKRVFKYLEKKLRKYENQDCDYYLVRWGAGPDIFPKEMFGEPKYVEFEGLSLPIPAKAGDFLRDLYGDEWVEVPEPAEQNPHNTITDFERGYEEYFKEFVPRIGYKQAVKKYEKIKFQILKTKKIQLEDGKRLWTLEGLKEKYLLEKRIKDEDIDPFIMFEKGEYSALLELFSNYMLRQGSGDYLGGGFWVGLIRRYDPVYIDLGDDYLSLLLWLWIYQGRLSKANKVLRARLMVNKAPLSPKAEEVSQFMKDMQNAIARYEEGEYEESLVLVKELIERAACPVVNLWKLRIRLEKILGILNTEEQVQWIDKCLEIVPEDGEILKYKTDIIYEQNGIEKTYQDYIYAYEHTRNGIVWMEIGDVFKKEFDWALNTINRYIEKNEYNLAIEIAKAWHLFAKDSVDLQYSYCKCLTEIEADIEKKEKKIISYIKKYPEDDRFKMLLKDVRKLQGKEKAYSEQEVRFYKASAWQEYAEIKHDLLDSDEKMDELYKLELLAKLNRKLGEVKEEFELYRTIVNRGGEFEFVNNNLSKDLISMIRIIYKNRENKFSEKLLLEWKMKYPDLQETVDYLIRYEIFPEENREQLSEWIANLSCDNEKFDVSINNLYKTMIIHKNFSEDLVHEEE